MIASGIQDCMKVENVSSLHCGHITLEETGKQIVLNKRIKMQIDCTEHQIVTNQIKIYNEYMGINNGYYLGKKTANYTQ